MVCADVYCVQGWRDTAAPISVVYRMYCDKDIVYRVPCRVYRDTPVQWCIVPALIDTALTYDSLFQ